MFYDTRTTEKIILTNLDKLISLISKINCSEQGQEQQQYFQAAETLINQTNPFLLQLLEGKEEFLIPMYKQLISQKLATFVRTNNDIVIKNTLNCLFSLPVFQKSQA
jgi:hypothetical protein